MVESSPIKYCLKKIYRPSLSPEQTASDLLGKNINIGTSGKTQTNREGFSIKDLRKREISPLNLKSAKRLLLDDSVAGKRVEYVGNEKGQLLILRQRAVENQIRLQKEEHEWKMKIFAEEHDAKIKTFQEKLDAKMKTFQEEHNAKLKILLEEHSNKIKTVQEQHNTTMKTLLEEHDARMKILQDDHHAKMRILQGEHVNTKTLLEEHDVRMKTFLEEVEEHDARIKQFDLRIKNEELKLKMKKLFNDFIIEKMESLVDENKLEAEFIDDIKIEVKEEPIEEADFPDTKTEVQYSEDDQIDQDLFVDMKKDGKGNDKKEAEINLEHSECTSVQVIDISDQLSDNDQIAEELLVDMKKDGKGNENKEAEINLEPSECTNIQEIDISDQFSDEGQSELREIKKKSVLDEEQVNNDILKPEMIGKKSSSQQRKIFMTLKNVCSLSKKIAEKGLEVNFESDEEEFFGNLLMSKFPLVKLQKLTDKEIKLLKYVFGKKKDDKVKFNEESEINMEPECTNLQERDISNQYSEDGQVMKFISGARGAKKLLFDGYVYHLEHATKRKMSKTFWRCERFLKCCGRLKIKGYIPVVVRNHSHPPYVELNPCRNKLLNIAEKELESRKM